MTALLMACSRVGCGHIGHHDGIEDAHTCRARVPGRFSGIGGFTVSRQG